MSKKKIVIFGPIGDFGGRDVEVNIIAKALENDFDVIILSSAYMTKHSFAIKGTKKTNWNCISKTLFDKNLVLKLLSKFSKLKSKGKKLDYFYCNNLLSKKLFNYNQLQLQIVENEIREASLVLCCVQLTTQFLPEVVNFCKKSNIPCLVRTTGTIYDFKIENFKFLNNVTTFIHHSKKNAQNLNKQTSLPFELIDQCANNEEKLLNIPIDVNETLRFGYLGRLSKEKGILPLTKFFSYNQYCFKIAGDGPQREVVLEAIKKNTNCEYLGQFSNEEIDLFFNQIDILVIPSLEESGPLVGLEAMAAGKLILSTDVGAMKERFEGLNGYWFDINNIKSLEMSLNRVQLLSKDDLKKQMHVNRQRYLIEYQEDKIKDKYRKLVCTFVK